MSRYTNFWRFGFEAATIDKMDDLISVLESLAEALPQMREWRAAGIELDDVQDRDNVGEGYIEFVTTDAAVAQRFGFDPEETDE